jgi:hypothetical protein
MPRTSFGKTRPVDTPYAEYAANNWGEGGNNWGEGGTVWRVLKTYKHSDAESKDPHARWFVAGKSPGTYGSWEYGDMYARDIKEYAEFVDGDPQWRDEYKV